MTPSRAKAVQGVVRTCIIFNPTACGAKAERFRMHLEELRHDFALRPTAAAGGARGLAAEAVREGFETVVAAGGDGTVNEVLNGIGDVPDAFSHVRLGVLALGTVNVFARELRMPLDLNRACGLLRAGREQRIDLPEATFNTVSGLERRYFVQLGGAGLDARAVHLVSWELKKRLGSVAYIAAGLKALRMAPAKITVRCGHTSQSGELVLFGNGRFYGGSLHVFEKADFSDGLLDICVFPRVNWFTMTRFAWSIAARNISAKRWEQIFQASEIALEGTSEALLELDGELAGHLPGKLCVHPGKLRVVVP